LYYLYLYRAMHCAWSFFVRAGIVAAFLYGTLFAFDNDTAMVKAPAINSPFTSFSADSSDARGIQQLDNMVVVAGRYAKELSVPQSFSLIKSDEWIGTGKSVADVVAEKTGVQTRRFGGRGSFQTVSIRGAEGGEVLVLLDGMPLNNAMGGAVDLGKINPLRLDGIELYRGMIPARFGGNGLGGVLNLKSAVPAPESESASALNVSLGNYGTRDFSLLAPMTAPLLFLHRSFLSRVIMLLNILTETIH